MLYKCGKYSRAYPAHMGPALNISSALECFERSDAIEIHNRIMLDFYPGLPHVGMASMLYSVCVTPTLTLLGTCSVNIIKLEC